MPKISIGVPIFNEEIFIANRLKNILEQTEVDFELIISDNASTDNTQNICEKFAKDDHRIVYVRQPKNLGAVFNFRYVLNKATSKYFIWASGDDLWHREFLEKISKQLDENKNLVCCMGKVVPYERAKGNDNIRILNTSRKFHLNNFHLESVFGTYENKVYRILHNPSFALYLYGLFRLEILKNSVNHSFQLNWDRGLVFNILKHGDLHTIDEILLFRYTKGMSNRSITDQYKMKNVTISELFFPYINLLKWYMKNLNKKLIIKNFDIFIKLALSGFIAIGISIFKKSNYRDGKKINWISNNAE